MSVETESYTKKQHTSNFMFDIPSMNHEIENILLKNNLTKKTNVFFNLENTDLQVSPEIAFNIASNWVEITKTFLFTVIQGLGLLAHKLLEEENPNNDQLTVLQTAYSVIADDLNNCHPVFKKVAPSGPAGIHYKWWENTILEKLRPTVNTHAVLSDETKMLVNKMRKFACDSMGAAVQLRIVEAIAFNIASSFLVVFGNVKYKDVPVFANEIDKTWITAHIEAEVVHSEKVSNDFSGMARIAQTPNEQNHMLQMTNDYCQAWSATLQCFTNLLRQS